MLPDRERFQQFKPHASILISRLTEALPKPFASAMPPDSSLAQGMSPHHTAPFAGMIAESLADFYRNSEIAKPEIATLLSSHRQFRRQDVDIPEAIQATGVLSRLAYRLRCKLLAKTFAGTITGT
jgi:hypothetical protein